MDRRFALAFPLILLVAGCGGGGGLTPSACDPPCAGGQICSVSGACADPIDLSATPPDLTVSCSPPCAGQTPYCSPKGQCVACLMDAQCPIGNVCKTGVLGNTCVAGCT